MKQKVLQVSGLTKRFPGVLALDDVSFDLEVGEVHALCGENGAGKSTLIKCLSGVWPVDAYEGDIWVNARRADFKHIKDAESAGIGVIYQELALVREMTVAENVYLGNEPTNRLGQIDWPKVYAATQSLLDKYNLDLDPTALVADLGIGQQQLVEVVKALLKNTSILLLDEPTAALTESEVDILLDIIRDLKNAGVTCVYISHKLDEVMQIADRVTVFRDGASIATSHIGAIDKSEIIRQMVGRNIDDFFPRRSSSPAKTLLSVTNLSVFDPLENKNCLEDISFIIRAGEVLGFGGLMGAGRTELVMHLFGAFGNRVSGEVICSGKPMHNSTPIDAINAGMMLVSEDRKRYGLVLEKDIGFNQSLASLPKFSQHGLLDHHAETLANKKLFKSLRIKAPTIESMVGGLSGGNQQKVVLAKALMTQPSLVFLDEPTRGIDVGAKLEVYELINQLTEQGKAVILVSSEMPELLGMSDRIIVLSDGKIGGEFVSAQTTQEQLLQAAMTHG